MSSIAGRWLIVIALAAPRLATAAEPCTAGDRAAADAAETLVAGGAFDRADERLRLAYAASDGCSELAIATWGVHGWRVARDAASTGGRPEDLAPAFHAVERLAPLGSAASAAAYAVAIVRAAAAAAQDERDELALWLDHASDVAERLALGPERPRWPLPLDVASGLLWLEVDDYALAERAFMRALKDRPSVVAWAGLARTLARQSRRSEACEAARAALAAASGGADDGAVVEARRYLLTCSP